MNKALTLSIIIPVFNEERQIKGCLDAIAAQSAAPDEVIVVDNNCTDRTIEYAKRYPFVRIVRESVQGLIAARNKGFNVAKGDILGRIDADVRLAPDWVQRVKRHFSGSDIGGLTGCALADSLPIVGGPQSTLWSRVYFLSTDAYLQSRVMWGANMAIRRTAWEVIKDEVCLDDTMVHEDQDMSILLASYGYRVHRDKDLLMYTDVQTYHQWRKFKEYAYRRMTTRRLHRGKGSLERSGALKRPAWHNVVANIVTFVPFIVFIGTSLALHAADAAWQRLRR